MSSPSGIGGAPTPINVAAVEQKAAVAKTKETVAEQEASSTTLVQNPDFSNPAAATRIKQKETSFKSLVSRKKTPSAPGEKKIKGIEKRHEGDLSEQYEEENPEMDAEDLKKLKSRISDDTSAEDILESVNSLYSDPVLALSALEFLSASTTSPKLKQTLLEAQNILIQNNSQAITGGKNILTASRLYGKELHTTPSSLRALYTQVTTSILSSNEMFLLLSKNYSHAEQKIASSFLLQGMTCDLKAEGPSIPPEKLQVLMNEVKSLQAVNSLYSYFEDSMPRLSLMLKSDNVSLPKTVTYEQLAQSFHTLITDKFPNSTKTQRQVQELAEGDPDVMSNILNLFYQALNQTSPRLFSSADHRQQLALTIANTLDILNINNDDYPHPNIFPKKPLN